MRTRILAPLTMLALLSGCHAMEKLRGWNGGAIISLSDGMIGNAQQIRTIVGAIKAARPPAPDVDAAPVSDADAEPDASAVTVEVVEISDEPGAETVPTVVDPLDALILLAKSIENAAVDCRDRGILVQLDSNNVPNESVVPGNPEDRLKKAAYAGAAFNRNDRRDWLKGLSERLAQGLARFGAMVLKSTAEAFVPQWILTLLGGLIAALLVAIFVMGFFWVRGKMFKKAAIQMTGIANQYVPADVLAQTKGMPAQRVYYYARDHGLIPPKPDGSVR